VKLTNRVARPYGHHAQLHPPRQVTFADCAERVRRLFLGIGAGRPLVDPHGTVARTKRIPSSSGPRPL
jgi:hypothetical protein